MPALLTRPLVQFLVGGALIFALFSVQDGVVDLNHITVSIERQQMMATHFEERSGRPPSDEEHRELVDRYIEDEVLFREALALDLHLTDEITRRRLIATMGYLGEGDAGFAEPEDADLQAYFEANAQAFRTPDRYSFSHIFLPTDAKVALIRAALEGGSDPAALGMPFPRGQEFERRTAAEVDALFGPGFAAQFDELKPGTWSAPITSAYGRHLVFIDTIERASDVTLAQVRRSVSALYRNDRRLEARARMMETLKARYRISVEPAE